MNRLIRSIIDFSDGINTPDLLLVNYQRLKDTAVVWTRPDDEKLFKFVEDFVQVHLGEVPDIHTVKDYFERTGDQDVIERLKDIAGTHCYTAGNFSHLLGDIIRQQNEAIFQTVLKSAQEISTRGLTVGEGRTQQRLHGIRDALQYVSDRSMKLLPSETNAEVRGDAREDTDKAWEEYQYAKNNPGAIGKLMGIDYIDEICRGARPGNLWIHAGFPGELKTSMALNWCYNLTTKYRTNVMFASLEMKLQDLRRSIYSMHTASRKFKQAGLVPPDFRGLDYLKIRDGELTQDQEKFYQHTLKDFHEDPEHCRLKFWCPDYDVTVSDIRMEAELTHRQMDLGFLVIDHGLLVKTESTSREFVTQMNQVVRDTKKLALHFNHGKSIPVLFLFQINRAGKDLATKNNGEYTAAALTYANECLAAGTLVHTSTGLVPIESVLVGASVWSRTGWKTVRHRFDNGIKDTIWVTTKGGPAIRCTPDHLFQTWDAKTGMAWVEAQHLLGTVVLEGLPDKGFGGGGVFMSNCAFHQVTAIAPAGPCQVYDLDVGGDHEYLTGGLLTHNCEKSADVITTTYLSQELREQGRTIMSNIKNRDNPLFKPCEVGVDFTSRKMYALSMAERGSSAGMGVEGPDEELLNATL